LAQAGVLRPLLAGAPRVAPKRAMAATAPAAPHGAEADRAPRADLAAGGGSALEGEEAPAMSLEAFLDGSAAGGRQPLAADLVRRALAPGSGTVGFREITELCERIEAEPDEAREAVAVIVVMLQTPRVPWRSRLQALTIAHEMMYDERTVAEFRSVPAFREALGALREARDTGLGDTTDENIRMLATEIDKICFSGGKAKVRKGHSRNSHGFGGGFPTLGRLQRHASEALEDVGSTSMIAMSKLAKTMDKTASKAIQEVDNAWDRADKTATEAMEKASKTIERTAASAMDGWNSLMGSETPDDSPASAKHGSKVYEAEPLPLESSLAAVGDQELELQWALSASLSDSQDKRAHRASQALAAAGAAQAQRAAAGAAASSAVPGASSARPPKGAGGYPASASAAPASMPPVTPAPLGSPGGSAVPLQLAGPMEKALESLRAAEARTARAEQGLREVSAREAEAEGEDRRLRRALAESRSCLDGLTDRLAEAEAERKQAEQRASELPGQLGALLAAAGASPAGAAAGAAAGAGEDPSPLPAPAFPVTFEAIDGSRRVVIFSRKPLGLTFQHVAGSPVSRIDHGGHAEELGVEVGWTFQAVGNQSVHQMDTKNLLKLIEEYTDCLPLEEPSPSELLGQLRAAEAGLRSLADKVALSHPSVQAASAERTSSSTRDDVAASCQVASQEQMSAGSMATAVPLQSRGEDVKPESQALSQEAEAVGAFSDSVQTEIPTHD